MRNVLTIFLCFVLTGAFAQTQNVDEILKANVPALSRIAGQTSRWTLLEAPRNTSDPENGMVFSRRILEKMLQHQQGIHPAFPVQFIIAHELAHQVQYHIYADALSSASCEKRRLYECQADVLAGVYIAKLYDLADSITFQNTDAVFMSTALEFLYTLGDEEYSQTSLHPSWSERRMAFRTGIAYALLEGNLGVSFKQMANGVVDRQADEDVYSWSLKAAKRINHFPVAITKNIMTGIDSDTLGKYMIWHKKGDHPILEFISNYYKNNNPFAVRLTVQCKLVAKNRDPGRQDPKLTTAQGQSKLYSMVLGPGDSICIRDTLNWHGLATKETMPSFLCSPKLETMYNAEAIQAQATPVQDSSCPLAIYADAEHEEPETGRSIPRLIALDLQKANASASNYFEDLSMGFGQETDNQREISYHANLGFKYNAQAKIVTRLWDGGQKELEIELYSDSDQNEALRKFNSGVEGLKLLSRQDTTFHLDVLADGKLIKQTRRKGGGQSEEMSGIFSNSGTEISLRYWVDKEKYETLAFAIIYVKAPERPWDIQGHVTNEMRRLMAIAGVDCKYSIYDGNKDISIPGQIKLSTDHLFRISRMDDDPKRLFCLRFILAHELAHQLLFKSGAHYEDSISCEQRRLYECQADVLAGVLMGNRYNQQDIDSSQVPGSLVGIFNYVYDLGETESGQQSHANPLQRRSAFRYGLGYSLHGAGQVRMLATGNDIDSRAGEDSIRWSARVARQIMHFPLNLTKMIVSTSSFFEFDTSRAHPYVNFQDCYYNRYDQPLRLNIAYEVCGVRRLYNRLQPDVVPRHVPQRGSIKYFSLVVPPHDSIHCAGELNWGSVGNANYMPKFIMNGDAEALYNVEALDSSMEDPGNSSCLINYYTTSNLSGQAKIKFFHCLDEATNALAMDEWQSLQRDLGHSENTRSLTTYTSNIEFPYSIKNSILIDYNPKNHWWPNGFMSVEFYAGNDSSSALNAYKRIEGLIKEHYQSKGVKWEEFQRSEEDDYTKSFEGELPENKLELSLSFHIRYGICITSMSLEKKVARKR